MCFFAARKSPFDRVLNNRPAFKCQRVDASIQMSEQDCVLCKWVIDRYITVYTARTVCGTLPSDFLLEFCVVVDEFIRRKNLRRRFRA